MSERFLSFLIGVGASTTAIIAGAVTFTVTALIYIAVGEVAAAFHMTIFNPTMAMIWVVYIIEVVAIFFQIYRFLKRICSPCVAA